MRRGELELLGGREQAVAAGLVEELLQRVRGEDGQVDVRVLRLLPARRRAAARAQSSVISSPRASSAAWTSLTCVLVERRASPRSAATSDSATHPCSSPRARGLRGQRERRSSSVTLVPSLARRRAMSGAARRRAANPARRRSARGVASPDVGAVDLDAERAPVRRGDASARRGARSAVTRGCAVTRPASPDSRRTKMRGDVARARRRRRRRPTASRRRARSGGQTLTGPRAEEGQRVRALDDHRGRLRRLAAGLDDAGAAAGRGRPRSARRRRRRRRSRRRAGRAAPGGRRRGASSRPSRRCPT